jgi:hypothetical protein
MMDVSYVPFDSCSGQRSLANLKHVTRLLPGCLSSMACCQSIVYIVCYGKQLIQGV